MRLRARRPRTNAEAAGLAGTWLLCGLGALAVVSSIACGAGGIFQPYEYEEDLYLSLDGSATIYVNSSVAALNALRGTSFDTNPSTSIDREAVRAYFDTPLTRVRGAVTTSRRSNRRFVHVRVDVEDVRRLGQAAPFAWSTYVFGRDGNLFVYRQTVGAPAGHQVGDVGWSGREVVAFRLHLPSKIEYHNAGPDNLKRGNILVWEQPLAERVRGVPVAIDARMQTQSILYRTLYLFGATFIAVAISFGVAIWWILKRGRQTADRAPAAGGA